ncbi:MAG: tetraacyldisaccharide 4'-kinase [Alphaproteobacteria bacterium]
MKTPSFWYTPTRTWKSHALRPLARLYGAGAWMHHTWRGRKVYRAPVPVISIGNLTAGGSGKTPLTLLLAQALEAHFRLAIVTGAQAEGDEAKLLVAHLPSAIVISHRNKQHGVAQAVARGATLIVLDDGFSRVDVARDVDVLTFGPSGIGNGLGIPAGPLRECLQAAARADCYVLQDTLLPTGLPVKPVFAFRRALDTTVVASLGGKPLVAFAALAHPDEFFNALTAAGLNVVETFSLPDHATFTPALHDTLNTLARTNGATLVCTEKDAMKLPPDLPYVAVPLALEGDVNGFINFITTCLKRRDRSNATST